MAAFWDLTCLTCRQVERNVACSIFAVPPCPACGGARGLTDTATYHPFVPYFDVALGAEVTSHAQRWRLMRQHHLDYRDTPRPGDLSARRDRCEAERKAQRERGERA